jgi:hypothetical protein
MTSTHEHTGTAMDPATHGDTAVDLTLRDAAALYDVTVKTLAQHLRCGQLVGYKSRCVTGREWRVTREALDDAGYRPRAQAADAGRSEGDELVRLRQELAAAKRAAAAERRRADDLDRRLGHALLECGHLRGALAAVTGEREHAELDLDAGTSRWLMTAIAGGATLRRDARRSSAL